MAHQNVQTQNVATTPLSVTSVEAGGRASELSRQMAVMADAAGPFAKKLIALDSQQPSQAWRQVAPAQINLNTQFDRPLSPGSMGFVGQPLGKNNLGGGFKTVATVSPTQLRLQADKLRRSLHVCPLVVKKGEAMVKRQFKNSKIRQKRSTAGFKFQNSTAVANSSKDADKKRLRPNEQLEGTCQAPFVSLGAITGKKVLAAQCKQSNSQSIERANNHGGVAKKGNKRRHVEEADDEVKIYETGFSARPTPSPVAFKHSMTRNDRGQRSQGTKSELTTQIYRSNYNNTHLSGSSPPQNPADLVKDGDCLMILANQSPAKLNYQSSGRQQPAAGEDQVQMQADGPPRLVDNDDDDDVLDQVVTAADVRTRQNVLIKNSQENSVKQDQQSHQNRGYSVSIIRVNDTQQHPQQLQQQQQQQLSQQEPRVVQPQHRQSAKLPNNHNTNANYNINLNGLSTTGAGQYQLNISATVIDQQNQLDDQSNQKHPLLCRTMTVQSPVAKVFEFQVYQNTNDNQQQTGGPSAIAKQTTTVANRRNSGGIQQNNTTRQLQQSAQLQQQQNDGTTQKMDDYIQIIAKPKRPTTGIQTQEGAATSNTVYNHIEDSKIIPVVPSSPTLKQADLSIGNRPLSAKSMQTNNYKLIKRINGAHASRDATRNNNNQQPSRLQMSQSQQRVSLINLMTQKSKQDAQLALSQSSKGMVVTPLEALSSESLSKKKQVKNSQKATTRQLQQSAAQLHVQSSSQNLASNVSLKGTHSTMIKKQQQQQALVHHSRSPNMQANMRRMLQYQQKTAQQEQFRINQRQRQDQQRKSSVIKGRGGGFINPAMIRNSTQCRQRALQASPQLAVREHAQPTATDKTSKITNLKIAEPLILTQAPIQDKQQVQTMQDKKNFPNQPKKVFREAVVLPQARIVEQISSPTHTRQISLNNPLSPHLHASPGTKRLTSATPGRRMTVHSRHPSRSFKKQQTVQVQDCREDTMAAAVRTEDFDLDSPELQQSINQLSNIMKQRRGQNLSNKTKKNARKLQASRQKAAVNRPTSSYAMQANLDSNTQTVNGGKNNTMQKRSSRGPINIKIDNGSIQELHPAPQTALNSGTTSPLERFKKLKQSEIQMRPSSASQKLRLILSKSNKTGSNSGKKSQAAPGHHSQWQQYNNLLDEQSTHFNPEYNAQPTALACFYSKTQHKGFQALSKAVSAQAIKEKQGLLKSNQDFALVASVVKPRPNAASSQSITRSTAKKQKGGRTILERRLGGAVASRKLQNTQDSAQMMYNYYGGEPASELTNIALKNQKGVDDVQQLLLSQTQNSQQSVLQSQLQARSYGGILSAMNVTERREQPGGANSDEVAVQAQDKDAMQSEFSSSLPASYCGIMPNVHNGNEGSHAANSNIASSRAHESNRDHFGGPRTADLHGGINLNQPYERQKDSTDGPLHAAHIKSSFSTKRQQAKSNSQQRNITSEGSKPTTTHRRFVKASSVANVRQNNQTQYSNNNTSQQNNMAMKSLQINQIGSMQQLKKTKLNEASQLIASERVLSNVVTESQNVPEWHPMPSAFDINKESIGATL